MSRKRTSRKKRRLRGAGVRGRSGAPGQVLAQNRRAPRDYVLLDRFEAGLALTGAEVKSCRNGGANLKDSYGREQGGELYLVNCHIAPYAHAPADQGNPDRARKLLLHADELRRLTGKLSTTGLTLIPLDIHLRGGWIKVQLALAKGKSHRDRRETIRRREAEREVRRTLAEHA